jgi:hypothetical protein
VLGSEKEGNGKYLVVRKQKKLINVKYYITGKLLFYAS